MRLRSAPERGTGLNLTGFVSVVAHMAVEMCALLFFLQKKKTLCRVRKTPLPRLMRGREPRVCFIRDFWKGKTSLVPEHPSGDCESQMMEAQVVGCIRTTARIPARLQGRLIWPLNVSPTHASARLQFYTRMPRVTNW